MPDGDQVKLVAEPAAVNVSVVPAQIAAVAVEKALTVGKAIVLTVTVRVVEQPKAVPINV